MHRYKELEIWKRSINLIVSVYELTKEFPSEEKFGLTNQLKRAVVSVASNIAEGAGRNSNKEFNQFLGIAMGSILEVETQLIIAEKLSYLKEDQLESLLDMIDQLIRMTKSLQNKLI